MVMRRWHFSLDRDQPDDPIPLIAWADVEDDLFKRIVARHDQEAKRLMKLAHRRKLSADLNTAQYTLVEKAHRDFIAHCVKPEDSSKSAALRGVMWWAALLMRSGRTGFRYYERRFFSLTVFREYRNGTPYLYVDSAVDYPSHFELPPLPRINVW